MLPVGRSLSWDDFESAHLLQFLPFEEARLGDRTLDIALVQHHMDGGLSWTRDYKLGTWFW